MIACAGSIIKCPFHYEFLGIEERFREKRSTSFVYPPALSPGVPKLDPNHMSANGPAHVHNAELPFPANRIVDKPRSLVAFRPLQTLASVCWHCIPVLHVLVHYRNLEQNSLYSHLLLYYLASLLTQHSTSSERTGTMNQVEYVLYPLASCNQPISFVPGLFSSRGFPTRLPKKLEPWVVGLFKRSRSTAKKTQRAKLIASNQVRGRRWCLREGS